MKIMIISEFDWSKYFNKDKIQLCYSELRLRERRTVPRRAVTKLKVPVVKYDPVLGKSSNYFYYVTTYKIK